jgi:hypothetical protein
VHAEASTNTVAAVGAGFLLAVLWFDMDFGSTTATDLVGDKVLIRIEALTDNRQ